MIPTLDLGLTALLLGCAVILLRWPELGTLLAVLLLYLNLPALAVKLHGLPHPVATASALLLVPALVQNFIGRRHPIIVDAPFLLMIAFLGVALLSTFVAKDTDLALLWIAKYLSEGVLLYFLVLNLVRNRHTLRRVIWILLVAGSVLGSMTLYQELTGSYTNEFGGLAQRTLEREPPEARFLGAYDWRSRTKIRVAHRAQGPIDDPNRYAQILLVLLPLGWCRLKDERAPLAKLLALLFLGVILGGVLLTYSRGGFLGLIAVLILMAGVRWVRLSHLLIAATAVVLAILLLAPGYSNRLLTLRGIEGLVSPTAETPPDPVERGRATEMLAAWNVFLDYPILGVGPGQFAPLYSISYMSQHYTLRWITEKRRAHSLYLELAAETGLLGITSFMAVVIVALRLLMGAGRRCAGRDPELGNLATGFWLGLAGYLVTGIFLQLSFQRYFWLLVALGGATVKIVESEEALAVEPEAVAQPARVGSAGTASR